MKNFAKNNNHILSLTVVCEKNLFRLIFTENYHDLSTTIQNENNLRYKCQY